jgi:Domain of unknown function (DUF4157)
MSRTAALAAPVAAPAAAQAPAHVPVQATGTPALRFGPTLRVQRQCACGGPAPVADTCDGCRRKKLLGLQTFAVGPADDAWEREADRIADEVMAGQRRSAATPVQPLAQRASVESCATGRGDSDTIKTGPLAKWDWVRYRDHIKLGNRVFKSPQKKNGQVVTGPDGEPVMARLVIGAWPWLTNNPGDITVDKTQIGKPRNAQNRAYDFGAMPRKSVSTGHVPLAVFDTMELGLQALQMLLSEPDYQDKTIRQAVDHHLGGANNKKRMAGVDDTHTAVDRIVSKLRSLGVKASADTRLSALKDAGHLDEAAQAVGFAEGVENVGLTYRCEGRDKTEDPKIPATVRSMYLKTIPDTTPPEVSKLLCCELPPAQRRTDTAAAPAVAAAQALPSAHGGQALEPAVRQDMEARFGFSFGQVRVHADASAARSAAGLGAHAYTLGTQIVFGAGRYAPAQAQGRRLLAHELAHVMQQHGGGATVAQRDLAIEPVAVDPTERKLSEADIQAAIAFNAGKLKGKQDLVLVRDVLGVAKEPAVSDRALALAVARFQAAHGVAQDGQLGPVTMLLVVEEFQAEDLAAEAEGLKKGFARGRFMDIDASFCGCEPVLEREIRQADVQIAEYTACGADASVADGPAVETCVEDRAKAAGRKLVTLGTTAPGGAINLTGQRKGACGPLMERIDLAHEQIHSVHDRALQQQHGAGSAAFTQAREDKATWVDNEIQSRNTDKSLARWALSVLERTCP